MSPRLDQRLELGLRDRVGVLGRPGAGALAAGRQSGGHAHGHEPRRRISPGRAGGGAPRSQSRSTWPTGSSARGHHPDLVDPEGGVRLHPAQERVEVVERVAAGERGALDLGGVAAHVGAVAVEHVDLVLHLVGVEAEEVAGVGVLRDQAQRLALAAAADQDRRAAGPDRRRDADRLGQAVVPALEGAVVVAPHLPADLQRLLEPLEPLGGGRERDAEAGVLALVPGRADARASPGRR